MDSIFTVTANDLSLLGPDGAVEIFRELLWAEATSSGISKSLINVPSAITVSDGGIDAEVSDATFSSKDNVIKKGLTRYQIKSGKFTLNDSNIKEILFDGKKKNIKPRIKSCLDKDGTLVIIFFGWDNPDHTDDECCKKFIKVLTDVDSKYKFAKFEIWRQNTLRGFFKSFISLSLKVKRNYKPHFQTHSSWSRDSDMKAIPEFGDKQIKLMSDIREELRKTDVPINIRILGEAGIGKTKLVLEATKTDDLAPLVIYCNSAKKFYDSDLMYELLRDDNDYRIILIIDECAPDERASIWNKIESHANRVRLITIYNEPDNSSNITFFEVPPLSKEQIKQILQSQAYNVPSDQADRFAEFCDGSPRVAHVLGYNLINNPEDLLKPPAHVDIWERYIVGSNEHHNPLVRQRRIVLLYLSLYKKFGYGEPYKKEAQSIANIVEEADRNITNAIFHEIIQELKKRKILQGETTLYITPKALHIYLWQMWWDTYGVSDEYIKITEKQSSSLQQWSSEMFVYAKESSITKQFAKNFFLKIDGSYLKTKEGAKRFSFLAEAYPEMALKTLQRTVGSWSKEELLEFTTGRREIIWALEKMVVWKELFHDAARILLVLAETENETWGNNASGIFCSLFSLGYGRVAPTECPPLERFPLLKEVMESQSKERRKLAFNACSVALQVRYISRMIGAEYQGLRKAPDLWMPKTYGELYEAYRQIWNYLFAQIEILKGDEQQQAINILLSHLRSLGSMEVFAQMVIDTIKDLGSRPYVDKRDVIKTITSLLHYNGKELPVQIRQQWQQINNELTGQDFHSLMIRYVGMDVFEDNFDDAGNQVDQVQPHIEELANQAKEDYNLLEPELCWLMTKQVPNGYRFGYELGKLDKGFSLWNRLLNRQIDAGKDSNVIFLSGYLRNMYGRSKRKWEIELESIAQNSTINKLTPELTWRSGMTDQAAQRILNLAELEIISYRELGMFAYGSRLQGASDKVFQTWIRYLLEQNKQDAIYVALSLYNFYYVHMSKEHKRLPNEELTFQLLTHPKLCVKDNDSTKDQMTDHYWEEIGKYFVKNFPEKSIELCKIILENLGNEGTIFYAFPPSPIYNVLDEITKQYPVEVWHEVVKYLDPPLGQQSFFIKQWLRDDEHSDERFSLFPFEEIWKWVDADIDQRAWHIASFLPQTFFIDEEKSCLARELLIRYGDREDVKEDLCCNFFTEGWIGPESQHFTNKKKYFIQLKEKETNQNVLSWLNKFIDIIDERIMTAKIEEERRGF